MVSHHQKSASCCSRNADMLIAPAPDSIADLSLTLWSWRLPGKWLPCRLLLARMRRQCGKPPSSPSYFHPKLTCLSQLRLLSQGGFPADYGILEPLFSRNGGWWWKIQTAFFDDAASLISGSFLFVLWVFWVLLGRLWYGVWRWGLRFCFRFRAAFWVFGSVAVFVCTAVSSRFLARFYYF